MKRITDAAFKYEFYTTQESINPKEGKTYYWFKGGAIHNSQSGMAGELLHGKYTKMYLSNQLAEQGEFTNGLKSGVWKTWYTNGIMESRQYWNNGFRMDTYLHYDMNGALLEKGNFRRDKKHGKWIDYTGKDTVTYKNGEIFVKKPKLTKAEKAAKKEEKARLKEENKKAEQAKKVEKANAKNNKSDQKVKPSGNNTSKKNTAPAKGSKNTTTAKPEKKEGFFKRLFGKKQPKPKTNGKSQ